VSTLPLDWRRIAWRGTVAGLTGGLLFGVFLYPAVARPSAGFIALYAAVCLAWGIGYAYLAETRSQLNTLPVLSGAAYGIVVYVVMQLVLYSVAAERMASALEVAYGGFATCLFFGLPIAIVTRLLSSRR
jgi:ACR3 family arsenite efflux pump ArsB